MTELNNEDRTRKLSLIKEIMEFRLNNDPEKEDTWYSDSFDELYDRPLATLEAIIHLQNRKRK